MENLKSGDVPALVTNIEVMNILSKRLTTRKEEDEAAAILEDGAVPATATESENNNNNNSNQKKNSKLRHRDYIEESVYEYLAHSACANANSNIEKMPEFVSKLRGNGKRKAKKPIAQESSNGGDDVIRSAAGAVKTEEGVIDEAVVRPISNNEEENNTNDRKIDDDQNYGLTDAETLQILNLMPTELVEIHLMIEDLTSRLNEDEQNRLLSLISEYSGVGAD